MKTRKIFSEKTKVFQDFVDEEKNNRKCGSAGTLTQDRQFRKLLLYTLSYGVLKASGFH